jgi:hypothetical protein
MGMNPDTHRFEQLDTPELFELAKAKGWKIFKVGEKVTLRETDFSVVDIAPNKLVLRPWGESPLKTAADLQARVAHVAGQMPRYRSHKEVSALKIAHVEHLGDDGTTYENPIVKVHFVDTSFEPVQICLRSIPTPDVGWYYVVYPDGYKSFSPASSFEEGYTYIG